MAYPVSRPLLRLLCLTLPLLGLTQLRATGYYVNDASLTGNLWTSAAGNDANPGTRAQPFASLKYVINNYVLGSGDTVYVDAGTYTDQTILVGSADAGVVMYGAGRDLVTFDGVNFTARFMDITGNDVRLYGMRATRYAYSTGLKGQALTIADASNVWVEECLFENLGTSGGEAPVYITTTATTSVTATLSHCVIRNNNGNYGGGVDVCSNTLSGVPSLSVFISNCVFENNSKNNYNGGSLLVYNGLSAGGSTRPPVVTVANTVLGSASMPCKAMRGGAVYVDDGAQVTFTGTCFGYNEATDVAGPDGGGAVYILDGTVSVTNGVFYNNSANTGTNKYGGAVFVNKLFSGTSTFTATQCIFHTNSGLDGGAIFADNSTLNLTNCLFYSNAAQDEGGAICVNDANALLTMYNCTVAGNTSAGGSSAHGGLESKNCNAITVKNSIFWGNTRDDVEDEGTGSINVSWSCVDPGGTPVYNNVTGNITTDPLFVNAAAADYRIQAGSPCVNTGNTDGGAAPTTDLVGTGRVGNPDMGAYEQPAISAVTLDCPSTRIQILPLSDYHLTAWCHDGTVFLQWDADPSSIMIAEGSEDATTFTPLQGTPLLKAPVYSLNLTPAQQHFRYFRLRIIDRSGTETFTPVVASGCAAPAGGMQVFPSHVQDLCTVELVMEAAAPLHICLYNLNGQQVLHTRTEAPEGYSRHELHLPALPAGVYLVQTENLRTGIRHTQRIVHE